MAVIPKQVVGSLRSRLEPDSQISYVWLADRRGLGVGEQVETHSMRRPRLLQEIGDRSVVALRITFSGARHPVDVVAVGSRLVEIRPYCGFPGCRCSTVADGPPLRAASELILHRARAVVGAADLQYPRGASWDLPRFPEDSAEPFPADDPILRDWYEDDLVDDEYEWLEDDWDGDDDDPSSQEDNPSEPPVRWVWNGLQDLINPPASWSPGHAELSEVVHAVVTGEDTLGDLCPDDDAWSIRLMARRVEAGLAGLKMLDSPGRGLEREWIADRVRVSAPPHRSLVELWRSLGTELLDAVSYPVETAVWLFDAVQSSGHGWCEQAAVLLDEAAEVVPDSVRMRIEDPVELLVSAGLELAAQCLDGAVPGTDVTGVDLWFRTGEAFAELEARGPILGANERGDLPAEGLVVVLGDPEARRSYLDAVELGIDGRASVRIADAEPSGPHLAALAVARRGWPVLLNLPEGESLFADHASLPHIRIQVDRTSDHHDRIAQEIKALVGRWNGLTPTGKDHWWESQPNLYLPSLVHALLLEYPDSLPSTAVLDALDEDRLRSLIHRAESAGLHHVANRLASLAGMGSSGTTGLSLRITFGAVIPDEPVVREFEFQLDRLGANAVVLPPGAVAPVHAAADVAETGAAVLWDSAGQTGRGPNWMANRADQLVVLGFRNLESTALSLDDLRSATVVALPGCGDLTPLAGRTIDVSTDEAALFVEGSLTLFDPVDVLLRDTIRSARRDALARQTSAIVRGRLGA